MRFPQGWCVKDAFWTIIIQWHEDVVGLNLIIIHNPTTWQSSEHLDRFPDPTVYYKEAKLRYRLLSVSDGGVWNPGGIHMLFRRKFQQYEKDYQDRPATYNYMIKHCAGLFRQINMREVHHTHH